MDDTGRVNVFEAPQHLVYEELNMVVCELLRSDYVVEVCTHQRRHQVSVIQNKLLCAQKILANSIKIQSICDTKQTSICSKNIS